MLKAYEVPNLLSILSPTVLADYTRSKNGDEPENLITNLSSRSCRSDIAPLSDATGSTANINSCYIVSNVSTITGKEMSFTIDLGEIAFVHAILVVEDFRAGEPDAIIDDD